MKRSTFGTAPNETSPVDPFALLDRLPRSIWPFATDRFHLACRRIDAEPTELLSWLRRDIDSDLADLGLMIEEHAEDHDLAASIYGRYDALATLKNAVDRLRPEAFAFARYVLGLEAGIAEGLSMGAKELRWTRGGTAQ